MYTVSDIIQGIKRIGVKPTDTLLVHSSMKALGSVEGRADGVLDAFISYMADGLLILPTHTWSYINADNNVFDVRSSPSCVGILTNLFMKRPGVIRSLHPTHSVAALGKDAAMYISGEERLDTPCARAGCWGKLYDRRAKMLFLGCSLACNTFLHGVEEWNDVPNRIAAGYEHLKIVDYEGRALDRPMHRHHSPGIDVSDHYAKMEDAFLYKGIAQKGRVGDADCFLCDAVGMADLTADFLMRNPALFSSFDPIPEAWYK